MPRVVWGLCEACRLPDISASLSASYLGDDYVWERDFSNGMAVDIPHFGANFTLSASQVIYAGGAVNNGIALSKQGHRMAELDYAKSRQQVYASIRWKRKTAAPKHGCARRYAASCAGPVRA